MVDYCPDVYDGRWHEVVIPLKDLYANSGPYNPKTTYELRVFTESPAGAKVDIYFDDIGFDNRAAAGKKR